MKQSNGKQLAKKMLIALVCGLIAGFGCIIFREHLNSSGQGELWKTINNILFLSSYYRDLSKELESCAADAGDLAKVPISMACLMARSTLLAVV